MQLYLHKLHSYIYKSLKGKGLGKYYVFDFLYKIFVNKIKTDFAIVKGHPMFLDDKDSLDLSINGFFEEFETELIESLIKRGQVVLDIGANIGYYSLIFAKLVGDKGKVYAFEPDPINFQILKRNVTLNSYTNIKLINKAVMDKERTINFYLHPTNKGAHKIFRDSKEDKLIKVDTITLDDYFSKNKIKVDFIKFDIQGAEGHALMGMKKFLKNNEKTKIITEFWPAGLKRGGSKAVDFLTYFQEQRYDFFNVDENNKTLTHVSVNYLLRQFTAKKDNYTNLLLMKK
ncbi:FkbM family methyltransferase [Patescibacteria group bacterium]